MLRSSTIKIHGLAGEYIFCIFVGVRVHMQRIEVIDQYPNVCTRYSPKLLSRSHYCHRLMLNMYEVKVGLFTFLTAFLCSATSQSGSKDYASFYCRSWLRLRGLRRSSRAGPSPSSSPHWKPQPSIRPLAQVCQSRYHSEGCTFPFSR